MRRAGSSHVPFALCSSPSLSSLSRSVHLLGSVIRPSSVIPSPHSLRNGGPPGRSEGKMGHERRSPHSFPRSVPSSVSWPGVSPLPPLLTSLTVGFSTRCRRYGSASRLSALPPSLLPTGRASPGERERLTPFGGACGAYMRRENGRCEVSSTSGSSVLRFSSLVCSSHCSLLPCLTRSPRLSLATPSAAPSFRSLPSLHCPSLSPSVPSPFIVVTVHSLHSSPSSHSGSEPKVT